LQKKRFFGVDGVGTTALISKLELRIMRHEFKDYEWSIISPMLPNKPRGVPHGRSHGIAEVVEEMCEACVGDVLRCRPLGVDDRGPITDPGIVPIWDLTTGRPSE
jgi:hypothetical protein